MKKLILVFALASCFTLTVNAQGTDRKIGNLIAVERTIDNVYQTCIDQFTTPTSDSDFYSCKFEAKKTAIDFAPSTKRLLTLSSPACSLEGFLQNSVILVIIEVKSAKSKLATAKACLQEALNASANKNSFKFEMYTLE